MSVLEELNALRAAGLARIAAADDLRVLDDVRVAYLGKKGSLTAVLRGLIALVRGRAPGCRQARQRCARRARERFG
jgi:phenylalanyl-tRNA synthetase alpha chain